MGDSFSLEIMEVYRHESTHGPLLQKYRPKENEKAAALREAELWLMHSSKDEHYAHPAYLAPFFSSVNGGKPNTLPSEEILVRDSGEPFVAQSGVLLRAAMWG
jgi:hypothetical protein